MRFSFRRARMLSILASFCISLIMVSVSFGQAGVANVTGTVKDGQGNVVPGATVTLISDQGTSRTATTNSIGIYSFPSIATGAYRIEVEAPGFKKALVSQFQA